MSIRRSYLAVLLLAVAGTIPAATASVDTVVSHEVRVTTGAAFETTPALGVAFHWSSGRPPRSVPSRARLLSAEHPRINCGPLPPCAVGYI